MDNLLILAAVALAVLFVLHRIEAPRKGRPFPYLWHCADCVRWGGAREVLDRETALNRHAEESGHFVLRGRPMDGRWTA